MKNYLKMNSIEKIHPASEIQKQFWMVNNLHPDSPAYNIASVLKIKGSLNKVAIEYSFNDILSRHEVLRSSFTVENNEILQTVIPHQKINITCDDFSQYPDKQAREEADKIINEYVNRPFNLEEWPLFRVKLLQLSAKEFLFFIVMHHIIIDLASKDIFSNEFSQLYNQFQEQDSIAISLPETIYSDFALYQKEMVDKKQYEPLLKFWQTSLSGQSGYLNLPLDHKRPLVDTEHGDMLHVELPPDITSGIRSLSHSLNVNVFTVMLAVYFVLLYRYSGQEDITVGTPLSNRRDEKWKNVFGCFVNIMPVAINVNGEAPFEDIVREVRRALLGAHRNQEIPFRMLVSEINQKREPSYNPLFQAGFTFEHPMQLQLNGLEIEPLTVRRYGSQLDLFLTLWEKKDTIAGYFEYNSDLFNSGSIERLSLNFTTLLKSILADASMQIDSLPILSDSEKKKILVEWNDTVEDYDLDICLHQLFEMQVKHSPDHEALVFRNRSLSYRELDSLANKLANKLRTMGVHRDSLVGVYMERSLEMVVSLYAILKAGGAYLPLEPGLPLHRIQLISEDANPVTIITQEHLKINLENIIDPLIVLDSEFQALAHESDEQPLVDINPDNLAYVIYTSGSTGNPKGVMIPHRGICNRLYWMQEYFKLDGNDRVLQKTPYSFDVSVWEFFWPLLFGGTLVIAEPDGHRDSAYLVKTIKENNITIIHFVPTMLDIFLREPEAGSCSSLRYCILSGEALSYALQERFFSIMPCLLYNLYGPTEASVDVTAWKCDKNSDKDYVPIGYPIANTQMYILNAALHPVPIGVTGDLYIGGVQLARGYLGQKELTDTKFIPRPFSQDKEARIYNTGDLARWHTDGSIEYIGRSDFQVKLHGLRIELGEIESILEEHTNISQAVVILKNDSTGPKLVAYYISKGSKPDTNDLRDFLKEKISAAHVPSYFINLDSFPQTTSGKVDRKLLPEPKFEQTKDSKVIEGPSNELEKTILSVWKELLNTDKIDIHANFFDAGGTSLLMTLVNLKLRELLQVEISMVEMFQYPTISSLAGFLKKDDKIEDDKKQIDNRTKKQRDYFQKIKSRKE